MSEPKPQSLAQLQAECATNSKDSFMTNGERAAYQYCARELAPHVEREAAAQAKSLADERRIASLLAILQRLEDWGVREDKMFTETREKTLFKLISDAQTLLHEYRTQYPRVEEEQ